VFQELPFQIADIPVDCELLFSMLPTVMHQADVVVSVLQETARGLTLCPVGVMGFDDQVVPRRTSVRAVRPVP
jgi:hypothetical protein